MTSPPTRACLSSFAPFRPSSRTPTPWLTVLYTCSLLFRAASSRSTLKRWSGHLAEQPRFAFLGKDRNTPQLDVGALHKMASQCLEEDPRFRKQAKMAYKLALRHELMWSLGEIGDDRPRALGFLPATARISIDIRRGGGQPAGDTSHPRAKPNKAADGRLSIFNLNEQGIDLDAVMVSLISENDPHFISVALHLTRRNRRYTRLRASESF